MKFAFFSGGTGTPKLLEGARSILEDHQLQVICNTGDDFIWNSLHISPDLDTVLYLFSEKLDVEKYWGRKDETFNSLETLGSLGLATWFQVGDRDLGLHLYRSHLLKEGFRLTEITGLICKHWGIEANILPMSDDLVTTEISSNYGKLHFQEYFVKHKTQVEVLNVEFSGGSQAVPPQGAQEALTRAKAVVIGPSNPVTSIGPILSIPWYHQWLQSCSQPVIAVSPIIGSNAFSGPTTTLMKAIGLENSPKGLAKYYQNLLDVLILDERDRDYKADVESFGIEPLFTNISLKTIEEKVKLAQFILDLI